MAKPAKPKKTTTKTTKTTKPLVKKTAKAASNPKAKVTTKTAAKTAKPAAKAVKPKKATKATKASTAKKVSSKAKAAPKKAATNKKVVTKKAPLKAAKKTTKTTKTNKPATAKGPSYNLNFAADLNNYCTLNSEALAVAEKGVRKALDTATVRFHANENKVANAKARLSALEASLETSKSQALRKQVKQTQKTIAKDSKTMDSANREVLALQEECEALSEAIAMGKALSAAILTCQSQPVAKNPKAEKTVNSKKEKSANNVEALKPKTNTNDKSKASKDFFNKKPEVREVIQNLPIEENAVLTENVVPDMAELEKASS